MRFLKNDENSFTDERFVAQPQKAAIMTIRNLAVQPVVFRRQVVGYRVGGAFRMCPDSLWDPIAHRAIFRTPERAARFLARVTSVPSWDLKMAEWVVGAAWEGTFSVL